MRPRKMILCIDSDLDALSVLSYALRIAGYGVFSVANAIDALAIFATEPIDLVLCDGTANSRKSANLIGCLKGIAKHIPMILLGKHADVGTFDHPADALLWKQVPMSELLERVKVMSARKRGPRKGSTRLAPAPPRTADIAVREAVCA